MRTDQEITAERNTFHDWCDQIVKQIGEGWENASHDELRGRFGDTVHRVTLCTDGPEWFIDGRPGVANRGRATIHGRWPHARDATQFDARGLDDYQAERKRWDRENPRITIALSRTIEDAAKEIKRRFLPEYVRTWGACCVQLRDYERRRDVEWQEYRGLCAALGVKASKEDPGREPPAAHVPIVGNDLYGTMKRAHGRIYLERMQVPTELGLKLAGMIREYIEEHTGQ